MSHLALVGLNFILLSVFGAIWYARKKCSVPVYCQSWHEYDDQQTVLVVPFICGLIIVAMSTLSGVPLWVVWAKNGFTLVALFIALLYFLMCIFGYALGMGSERVERCGGYLVLLFDLLFVIWFGVTKLVWSV